MNLIQNKFFHNENKIGLVLEGGGAKGSYQYGALRALIEAGINFDCITGTSIGALNGAIFIQGGINKLDEFWEDVRVSKLFEMEDEMVEKLDESDIDFELINSYARLAKNFKTKLNHSTQMIRNYFASFFDEETLRNSSIDLGLVTYSLSDFKTIQIYKNDIPSGQLSDYLLASANCPPYGFIEIEGKKYVDGVFGDNLPINLMLKKKYKNIIVIRTNTKKPRKKLKNNSAKILYITPSEYIGIGAYFTKSRIDRNKKLGYLDASRITKNLKGKYFYIDNFQDDSTINLLSQIPYSFYEHVFCKIEKETVQLDKRNAVLKFLMLLKNEMDLETIDYDEIFINFLELFALIFKIERLQKYTYQEFIEILMCKTFENGIVFNEFKENTKDVKKEKLQEIFFILIQALNRN